MKITILPLRFNNVASNKLIFAILFEWQLKYLLSDIIYIVKYNHIES
jgi:hypothetical protein